MTVLNLSRPEEDIRLICLELAIRASRPGDDCVEAARAFFAFVTGASDASPPIQAMEGHAA